MEIPFKDLHCYKAEEITEIDSDFYKPNNSFDLSLLPNTGIRDEIAAFIIYRGKTLTFKSLYVDWRHYLLFATFLTETYPDVDSLFSLDLDIVIPQMERWLISNGKQAQVKSGGTYIPHPSIVYLQLAVRFLTPKNYVYFKDLECYKDLPEEANSSCRYAPDSYFDLEILPASLIPEMKDFILHRGKILKFTSIEKERMSYTYVADFLATYYKNLNSLYEMDKTQCQRKLKAYLMKNGHPISYTRKRRSSETKEAINHPAINYMAQILDYFTKDDGLFHFEDDRWYFDRLNFPVRSADIKADKSINFSKIAQEKMKNEVKNAIMLRLRQVSTGTVKANLIAVTFFCNYLMNAYPEIESFTEIDREVLESYLLYLNTEDDRKSNYHSELMNLKSLFNALAMTTEELTLMNLFLPDDIPHKNIPIYKFYTDNELRTLNRGFKTLAPQLGRLMILHEILGCRISETLTLKTDCIRQDENGKYYVHIDQAKVNRSYRKPINDDIKLLIEASIAYTKEHYGDCEYVFVSDNDPSKPYKYESVRYGLKCMILENDLRDDHGNLFKIGTHIFRRTYGRRLCDMGLDDVVISKLLGHKGTSAVKNYRRMTSSVLANGTNTIRDEKNEMINKYKGGWN